MFQPHRVADLVDDFLAHAVGEDVGGAPVRKAAVAGGLESVGRDDAAVAVEVGEAEDVVPAAVEEVLGRDGDVLLAGAESAGEFDELLCAVLVALFVVRPGGNGLGFVDGDVTVVDRAQGGGGLPLDRCRYVPDWDDVDEHGNYYAGPPHKHPAVQPQTRDAIVGRLSAFETLVEVGIGNRTEVAGALADAGKIVTATDVHHRDVPPGVEFTEDDAFDPDIAVYRVADAVYALNVPPELHRPLLDVAEAVDAALLFTTLGGDQPAIPVERETLPGETLFVARE